MALRHGRNVSIYVNGVDLSGDLNAINPTSEQELADVSAFGTAGHQFYPGLAKDKGTFEGMYNSTSSTVIVAMAQLTPSYGMMIPFGTAIGDPAYGCKEAMLLSHSVKSVVSDVNRVSVSFDTDDYPFEKSAMLTAGIQSVAAASTGTGTSVNNGSASATTGGAVYLQVFSVAGGGTLTVSMQSSSTGAFAGEQVTTATFAAASSNEAQRVAIGAQIPQYTRSAWVGATGISSFAMALARY